MMTRLLADTPIQSNKSLQEMPGDDYDVANTVWMLQRGPITSSDPRHLIPVMSFEDEHTLVVSIII